MERSAMQSSPRLIEQYGDESASKHRIEWNDLIDGHILDLFHGFGRQDK